MNKKIHSLDVEKTNSAVNLDAKLHQGYDPSTEFKHTGNLFSSVSYSESHTSRPDHTASFTKPESLWTRVVETIETFFNPDWHEIEKSRDSSSLPLPNQPNQQSNETTIYENALRQSGQNHESLQNDELINSDTARSSQLANITEASNYALRGYAAARRRRRRGRRR